MKKTIYCTLLLLFAIAINVNAQTTKKNNKPAALKTVAIKLEKVNCNFDYKKVPDQITQWVGEGVQIKVTLTGSKGACTFYTFNKQNKTLLKGSYADAVNLEEEKIDVLDKDGNMLGTKTIREYKPLPTGEWTYYSETGEVIKKETYVNGQMVK